MALLLEPGDVFVTRGRSVLARIIRRAEKSPGESPSVVNHVGIVVQYGPIDKAKMVEADWRVHMRTLTEEYRGKKDMVAIARPVLPIAVRGEMAALAMSMVGKPYGVLELPLHFGDYLLSRLVRRDIRFFRRAARTKRTVICSTLVGVVFAIKAGWRFCNVPENQVQPDDVWDDWYDTKRGHPDRWMTILPLVKL